MSWFIVSAYLVGLATVPLLKILAGLVLWAFAKSTGTGACVTKCKGSRNMEAGEHLNIVVWAEYTWHRLVYSTRPSHKAAVTKFWQDIYDAGGQTRTDVGVNQWRKDTGARA